MSRNYRDILLVDDDAVVRAMLADLLKPAGFRVRQARNGVEAMRMVREDCPYIVITDWVMASMDGIEFCRSLRGLELPHYVYVILLTAKCQEENVITGLNAGADDFLTKPFSRGELSARLQTAQRILELESRLNDLARRDSLTGVLNRRTFHEVFQREWSRAVRYRHPLSCVMIDIDYFKKVNDTYGHLVGDHVLRFLAQSLEGQSRCPDYVCRWGGEEFCVLLPETDERGAQTWAERCCWTIAGAEFSSDEYNFAMTASFGVAERQEDVRTPEQLLDRADQALYAAKRAGRHRVVCFESITPRESIPETGEAGLGAKAEPVCVP
jgi:two-component system, cell cycle response regulator